jgi:hypothetical protein
MENNVVKFDFVKKALIENAVEKKQPKLIRQAIDFGKSILNKFTFKVKEKKALTHKITIKPVYIKDENFEGVGYQVYIDEEKAAPYIFCQLEYAEEQAKLLAVEYVLEIEASQPTI